MSVEIDISKGVDPIPVLSDLRNDCYRCFVDGKSYTFIGHLPFTLKAVRQRGYDSPCADKSLILKHSDKALIKDSLEDVRKGNYIFNYRATNQTEPQG